MIKAQNKSTKQILTVAVIVLFVTLLVQIGAFFIAHPTTKHIETADRLGLLMGDATSAVPDLANSREALYSSSATLITAFVQLLIFAGGVGFVYSYLRKNRVVNPGGKTAGIFAVTQSLAYVLSMVFLGLYVSLSTSPVLWIVGFLSALFGSLVFAVIVIFITEKIYNHRHSFTVE